MSGTNPRVEAVVLDLDGTLVDSVPMHVLAWQAAFRDVGLSVPTHRLHRAIGMGGDRLVAHVAGDAAEAALGDELRERHPHHLEEYFGAIVATEGATELLEALQKHHIDVVLATSSERSIAERLLDVVPSAHELIQHTVTSSDAEESKPHGELMRVALQRVGTSNAIALGDAVWDVHAASDAGIGCIGLLTGGISEAELLAAGAVSVYDAPRALAAHVVSTGGLLLPG